MHTLGHMFVDKIGEELGKELFKKHPLLFLLVLGLLIAYAILFGKRSEEEGAEPQAAAKAVVCPSCKSIEPRESLKCSKCGAFLPPGEEAPLRSKPPLAAGSKLGLVALFAVALLFLWPRIKKKEWSAQSPPGEPFTVEMPGKPALTEETASLPDGRSIRSRLYLAETPDNGAYGVDYLELPSGDFDPERALDGALEKGMQGILAKDHGSIVAHRSADSNGLRGREVEAELEKHGLAVMRGLLAGDRLYILMYVHARDSDEPADRKRFFDSFALTGPQPRRSAAPAGPPAVATQTASAAAAPAAWSGRVLSGGSFAVYMPVKPKIAPSSLGGGRGTAYRAEHGGRSYVVTTFEIPPGFSDNPDLAAKQMEAAESEFAKELGGSPGGRRFTLVDNAPGGEFEVLRQGAARAVVRDVKWERTAIFLAFSSARGSPDGPDRTGGASSSL
ncbi:MAG: hypothetical protein HY077_03275 [Elusimicrobia bacterium]|nr:hypothetical protein [Elusimicrobiota bacterium]